MEEEEGGAVTDVLPPDGYMHRPCTCGDHRIFADLCKTCLQRMHYGEQDDIAQLRKQLAEAQRNFEAEIDHRKSAIVSTRRAEEQLAKATKQRDEANAELDDMRRAWAVLNEPNELQRMDGTAEDAAHKFVSKLAAVTKQRNELVQLTLDQQHFNGRLVRESGAAEAASAKLAALVAEWLEHCECHPDEVAPMLHERTRAAIADYSKERGE